MSTKQVGRIAEELVDELNREAHQESIRLGRAVGRTEWLERILRERYARQRRIRRAREQEKGAGR